MRIDKLLLLLVCTAILACNAGVKEQGDSKDSIAPYAPVYHDTSLIDTLTPHHNALRVLTGREISITWGKDTASRKFVPAKDVQGPYRLDVSPDLLWDNDDFIILGYGCGSPCYNALILPLDTSSPFERLFPLAFTEVRGLLASLTAPDTLMIESLDDRRKQNIAIDAFNGVNLWNDIDTCFFDGKYFEVRWFVHGEKHEKRIAIKLQ